MTLLKNVTLVASGAAGAALALNKISRPLKIQGIGGAMRRQLDQYNATVRPEQDRSDTILDRMQQMGNAKIEKPWNRTYAENDRSAPS